ETIFSKSRHPFNWDGLSCQPCHVDHRGALTTDMTQVDTSQTCGQCHEENKVLSARALLGVTAKEAYARLSYTAFPHASHTGLDHRGEAMTCTTCHAFSEAPELASVAEGRPRREFARIKYESCQECHESSGRAGTTWDFAWHGSGATEGEASRCTNCHEQPLSPERKTLPRVKREDALALGSRFDLSLRAHEAEMAAHRNIGEDSCHLCHRDEKILTARIDDRRFLHGLHLTSVDPASPFASRVEGECRECHSDVVTGDRAFSLSEGGYHHGMTTCTPCHEIGSLRPNRSDIDPARLERRNAFPHAYHLDRTKPGLEAGCVSCHPVSADLREAAPPQTTAEAMSCIPCHQEHRHVGGGDCSVCHPAGDVSLLGGTVTKLWPLPNRFSHKTRGHDGDCASCHGPLDQSQSLLDVPIPDESHPSCVQCHVQEKARFHFGR
ncbi:MAG TPA: cytochrome c3 family protein, partial [Planctomycetota bacterium]|nr:cytochrome c3 family protein [Planctomycetota bacterium]